MRIVRKSRNYSVAKAKRQDKWFIRLKKVWMRQRMINLISNEFKYFLEFFIVFSKDKLNCKILEQTKYMIEENRN